MSKSVCAVLLMVAGLSSAGETYPPGYEFITHPAFRRGEKAAWTEAMLDQLEKTPNEHRSEVIIRMMRNELTSLPAWQMKYLPRLEALLAAQPRNNFVVRHLRLLLMDCYVELMRKADARRVIEPLGYIEHWHAAPVPTGVRSTRGRLFMETEPEKSPALDRTYLLGWRTLGWQELYLPGLLGTVSAERLRGLPYDVVYLQAQVNASEKLDGMLNVSYGSGSGLALWINGRRTCLLDSADAEIGGELYVPAALQAGWNNIMLKLPVSGHFGGLRISYVLPDGSPVKLAAETSGRTHPMPPPLPQRRDVKVQDALDFYRKLAAEGHLDVREAALANCTASILAAMSGQQEKASFFSSAAYAADGSSPVIGFFHAQAAERFMRLPEGYRKNRSRDMLRKVLQAAPDFLLARLDLAEDYMSEDKLPDAFAMLDDGIRDAADSLTLRLAYLEMVKRAGERKAAVPDADTPWSSLPKTTWFDMEKTQIDAMEALAPALPALPILQAEYWQKRSQPQLALKALEDSLKSIPTRALHAACFRQYVHTGNTAKALA
ncbi:MAG TPA: hypothetical protein ENN09_07030, partial [Planctomycetes bacterium]|nr:hypothetical protein [Planctomycetota bacterium]